jgi:hypothetical protein
MRLHEATGVTGMPGKNDTIETSWQDIEAMNQSMHAAANAEEWQQVMACATDRHQRLLAHFKRFPVGPKYAQFYQQHLNEMLSGERQLQALANNARKRVMSDSVAINKNRRALDVYLTP